MLRKLAGALLAVALASGAQAQAGPAEPGPIAIHGNRQTFEIAPVLLAAEKFYPGGATVKMGGIPNLVGEPIIPGFGEEGWPTSRPMPRPRRCAIRSGTRTCGS